MTGNEFAKAVDYVLDRYCLGSGNELECDVCVPLPENHSEGDEGCWIKVWAWVPRDKYEDQS